MGNTFTIFGRHALKRARRFNVQNRTEKYLERHKDKPERAPLYEATMKEVEKVMKEMPDLTEEIKKKDGTLLNNLRDVYVTSTGENKDSFSTKRIDSSREARYLEAIKPKGEVLKDVPPGKYTMQQALTIIKEYQRNPMMNTPKALADRFNLESSVVAKITKHVKILDFYDTRKKQSKFDLMMKDMVPRSYQGKTEMELMEELELKAIDRSKILFEKAAQLRASKDNKELLIEPNNDAIENLLSKETADRKEQIYTDLEIYRKTGKLPGEPKLIEGRRIDDLSIEDIKRLTFGSDSSTKSTDPIDSNDKESDKKGVSEDKKKAAN